MDNVTETIKTFTENTIGERNDLFVVDVKVSGNKGTQKVVVLVDGDQGVSIDDCSDISRKLSELLDLEDVFSDRYTLEVSSPGLDFPLMYKRQYIKNIGRRVKVKLKEGKVIKGTLIDVGEEAITLKEDKKSKKSKSGDDEIVIPFDEVVRTNVLVTF